MDDPFIILDEDKTIKQKQVRDYDNRGFDGGFLFGLGERGDSLQILINRKRIFWFLIIIFLCLASIFFKVFYLQIIRGSYYKNIAEGNRVRIKELRADRGVIWAKGGELLVRNVPKFSLFFIPADLPKEEKEREEVLKTVADILGKDYWELKGPVEASFKFSYEPVLIEDDLPYEKAMLLEIKSENFGGIVLETMARREYLESGDGLAHILGYTSKLLEEDFFNLKNKGYLFNDYIGRTGLERVYESELRGVYGKKKIEVDFLGKEENVLSSQPSGRGKDLILAIDIDLQKKASRTLKKYLEEFKVSAGAVIVMDPDTGQILGLVSLPDYDNNLFGLGISEEEYKQLIEDEDKPLFNRAVSGEYPPGSTFKLAELVGALEEGVVSPETRILSTGGIRIGEWYFPDWKAGGHGEVSAVQAIAESVNTYFYYVGGGYPLAGGGGEDFKGLGVGRINHWAYLFGMGQKLGIDLLGEEAGFLPDRDWKLKYKNEPWYIGDTYHLAIGQGDVLVTPLQVAGFTATIANGGTLYRPRLVLGLGDFRQRVFLETYKEPEVIRKDFVLDKNLAVVRQGMREAVIYGSSRALNSLPIEVAGKTGTAQVGGDKEPQAWFTGFAPYGEPEIVITVLVENGGEGSRTAVPIAREILEYYFGDKD